MIRRLWQVLGGDMPNADHHLGHRPYRPERHYMRGPGPRWHAKYDVPASPPAKSS